MKTEMEKCLAGEWYDCHDPFFMDLKSKAHHLLMKYNSLPYEWKSHSTLTLLATQDLPTFLYYMIDPLKSWCWGAILFYPFKNSRFS